MLNNPKNRKVLFVAVLALCALSRFLPHPPNFTAIGALALFSGFVFSKRSLALVFPLIVMVATDLVIGTYEWGTMMFVYIGLCLPVFLGAMNRSRPSALGLGASAAAGSLAFFGLSNVGVWLFSGMYSLTPAGLVQCFASALPFYKYTLGGDLLCVAILFGGYALLTRMATLPRVSRTVPAHLAV